MKTANIDLVFSEVPGKLCLGVWTVGCANKCDGCHNPELQDFEAEGREWTQDEFCDQICRSCSFMVAGICWLGGEPTQQRDFPDILLRLKALMPDKIQVLYTGNSFSSLNETVKECLDVVIDGRWQGRTVQDEETNQKVWVKKRDGTWGTILWEELGKWEKGM